MGDVSLKAKATYTPRGSGGQFIAARVTPGVIASVRAAQGLIVQEAKNNAPVRTGTLRDSIAASEPEETGKTVVGRVGVGVSYGAFVEYGTGIAGAASAGAGEGPYSPTWPGMEARPFLRPALDTTRGAVKEIFASNLSIALKE